jgi:hypothetical protein
VLVTSAAEPKRLSQGKVTGVGVGPASSCGKADDGADQGLSMMPWMRSISDGGGSATLGCGSAAASGRLSAQAAAPTGGHPSDRAPATARSPGNHWPESKVASRRSSGGQVASAGRRDGSSGGHVASVGRRDGSSGGHAASDGDQAGSSGGQAGSGGISSSLGDQTSQGRLLPRLAHPPAADRAPPSAHAPGAAAAFSARHAPAAWPLPWPLAPESALIGASDSKPSRDLTSSKPVCPIASRPAARPAPTDKSRRVRNGGKTGPSGSGTAGSGKGWLRVDRTSPTVGQAGSSMA